MKNSAKNFTAFLAAALFVCAAASAQTNVSVPIDDNVYETIDKAVIKGLCRPMTSAKPWSEKIIKETINDILAANDALDEKRLRPVEERILQDKLDELERKQGFDWRRMMYHYESEKKFHKSIEVSGSVETSVSGGIYDDSGMNEWGLNFLLTVSASGDLSKYFSWDFNVFGNLARAVLQEKCDDYNIGHWWYTYETDDPDYFKDETRPRKARLIKTYRNNAYFPFSYHKTWDGSVYKPGNMTASGLEGWADDLAFGFGINAEMSVNVLNNAMQFRLGRIRHEWAAMDTGASLVLNKGARAMLAIEQIYTPLKWLSISSLTGALEFPNSEFIVGDIYKSACYSDRKQENAYFFQNAFSITMIELNFKYVHFDFGTTSVWPKRFELGYFFPLMSAVFYQNSVGDYDNIALFADLKLSLPKVGYIWASLFLDEINGLSGENGIFGDFIHATRDMYAAQAGIKLNFPWLPMASVALRYTKVEPYCYTHNSLNYTPWYEHYISEAYMNAGECIGYYLPPNSDEIDFRFEASPLSNLALHAEYQFARHGADYGRQQVNGSSIYSELDPKGRDDRKKYFLHDGAYEWFHIARLGGELSLKKYGAPVKIMGDIGFVYSYFTVLDDDSKANANEKFDYKKADSDDSDYPPSFGLILSLGVKVFF